MLAPKTINRSSYVLLQEMFKMIFSLTALYAGGTLGQSLRCLSIDSWVLIAGVPAVLYVVQNYCSLVAYQNLPPVTFNVLNQTKTLSAAFFVYVLMGKPQSNLQLVSLALLSFSALVLEKVVHLPWKKKTKTGSQSIRLDERDSFISGVLPVLIASAVSGLAGVSPKTKLLYQITIF
jgi:UDP-sugar transporter A1/2/3